MQCIAFPTGGRQSRSYGWCASHTTWSVHAGHGSHRDVNRNIPCGQGLVGDGVQPQLREQRTQPWFVFNSIQHAQTPPAVWVRASIEQSLPVNSSKR